MSKKKTPEEAANIFEKIIKASVTQKAESSNRITLPLHKGRTDDISLYQEDGKRYKTLIIHNFDDLYNVKSRIGFLWNIHNEGGTDYISLVFSYDLNSKYNSFFLESTIEPEIELL